MRNLFLVFGSFRTVATLVMALAGARLASAYSVLSHEALIDALWNVEIKRVLLARFPDATPAELKEAHAYAYGGAIIQDEGYYPHGNGYFSDLTHYVRSADFIVALIADAKTLDEYAFAVGALSHYYGDNVGHRYGTNVAEPQLYKKLLRKFGPVVTYADDETAHLQTEYGFDVEEVAKGNYASAAYHDFIGFAVAMPLLERAFREIYGFDVQTMFNGDFDRAIGSYRYALSTLIPFFTRVAWAAHADEIRRTRPSQTKRTFLYSLKRSNYRREWGRNYQGPSLWDRILAFVVKLLPPIGEIKVLRFKTLTPPVEQVMMHSFDLATPGFRSALETSGTGQLPLENVNFDTGAAIKPGGYTIADDTYAYWLHELAKSSFVGVDERIRADLLRFYGDLSAPIHTKEKKQQWNQVLSELNALKGNDHRTSFGLPTRTATPGEK